MLKPIRVTGALITDGDKILIARRAPGQSLAGHWEFPGGKVEPGETPEESLRRELYEELGIVAEVGEHFATSVHHHPRGTIELQVYFARIKSGQLVLKVHDAVAWVTPGELLEYDLLPADLPIAQRLLAACRG